MVSIPILSGVVATQQAEFVQTYPLNLEPVVVNSQIAAGQLRATAGAVPYATAPGIDRGGVLWNGRHYRVMGSQFGLVEGGAFTAIGSVGGTGYVRLDYSFDRLGIQSEERLYYFNGTTLTQVTDQDLGRVVDMLWVDGFWMTTDGTAIVVTELNNPLEIKPLKYGSAEEDPDPITGLFKLRREVYALGRHTIQVFRNVGGNGFPFANVPGAAIPFGCVSASAKCAYGDSFAFVGSKRDHALSVFVAGQGDATPISTRTVEDALAAVADPTSIVLESRSYRAEQRLFVHLPDETWVFLAQASQKAGEPVWYRARSQGPYRIRNAVTTPDGIIVGDSGAPRLGRLDEGTDVHFDIAPEWGFDAGMIYNEGRGGIVHSVELIGLPGRAKTRDAVAFMAWTRDGETFSVDRAVSMGAPGERRKRMQWRPKTRFSNYLGLRFRGVGGMPGFAKIEAKISPLAV